MSPSDRFEFNLSYVSIYSSPLSLPKGFFLNCNKTKRKPSILKMSGVWRNVKFSALQWNVIPCFLNVSPKESMYGKKNKGPKTEPCSTPCFHSLGRLDSVLCCVFRCFKAQMISCRTCIRTTSRLSKRRKGNLRSASASLNGPAESARGWTASNLTC